MPVTIIGDVNLITNLRRLGSYPAARDADKIALLSLDPLVRMTNARAPRPQLKTGAVARKRRGGSGKGRREYWVAFRRGMPMRIAHLVEFGTQPHSVKWGASVRKGIFVGEPPMHPGTPPFPFFRPAFEQTKNEVIKLFGDLFYAGMIQAVRTLRR